MKKLNLLFAMASALLLLKPKSSDAQITAVSARLTDSVYTYCVLPNNVDFFISSSMTGSGTGMDSMIFNVNFGDGSDTTFKRPITFSGSGYSNGYVSHNYTFAGTFVCRLIAEAPSGVKDTAYSGSMTFTNTCGTLNGYLYVDTNANCTKDLYEEGLYWAPIVAINTVSLDTTNAGWANSSGAYSINLPAGNYNIIPGYYYSGSGLVKTNPYLSPSCPSTGAYSLTVVASTSYTKDFAYTCGTPSSYDAQVVLSGGCFVPGDTTALYLWGGSWAWYYHYSCISSGVSTSVTVNLDPSLSYLGTYYGLVPTVTGSTLSYTLSTVADISRFYSGIMLRTPTTATIGDTIRMSAYIAPLTGITDPNLTNNTYNYKKAVASSYDPNIKEVAEIGFGIEGYIAPNREMTYTIHFQNTGTAAAKNVTIADEIDVDLDINTIHILGATHNTNMFKDGSTIKFRFENINLPDSGTNYFGSMGSVTYAIKQKKDLAPGTKMTNTAAIYFDYNAPIITNTTLNTIVIPTSIEQVILGNDVVSIYPNPASNNLNVKMLNTTDFSIKMFDMLGRTTLVQNTSVGELNINTSSIPGGLYIVTVIDNKGNQSSNKVQIKH